MLTILNYDKLYKKDIVNSHWRIGKIEQISTAYLIQLKSPTGQKMQINLERTPIGVPTGLYELWCWNDDRPTAVPVRTMLTFNDLKNIDKVLNGIEFLIKTKVVC